MQLDELGAGLHPQLGVEVRQRLVHQERRGLAHDGAGEGHALALPAAQLAGLATEEPGEADEAGRLVDEGLTLGAGHAPGAERELDVPPDGHVWVQGVGLEDHGQVPVLGRDVGDDPVADPDGARRRLLETRDDAQDGRLAAPGGAEEHEQLLVAGFERQVVDGDDLVEALRHAFECDSAHGTGSSRHPRRGGAQPTGPVRGAPVNGS